MNDPKVFVPAQGDICAASAGPRQLVVLDEPDHEGCVRALALAATRGPGS